MLSTHQNDRTDILAAANRRLDAVLHAGDDLLAVAHLPTVRGRVSLAPASQPPSLGHLTDMRQLGENAVPALRLQHGLRLGAHLVQQRLHLGRGPRLRRGGV